MSLKSHLLIVSCISICAFAISLPRSKREAYVLPDGVEEYIGNIRTSSFACPSFGYFADVDNDCKIFHLCLPNDKQETIQHTFACGNQTIFSQFSLTCTHPSESIPCASSPDFYYLNDRIGKLNELFHQEQDVAKLSNYVSNKI